MATARLTAIRIAAIRQMVRLFSWLLLSVLLWTHQLEFKLIMEAN